MVMFDCVNSYFWFFFFKQKTAYEMRISDWSSDVCSSDLRREKPLTPTKLLVGQIFVVFEIVIAGVWAATQWCAAQLGYQPQLGPAWFILFDTPVYRPWSIFPWWYHFEAYAPEVFDKAGILAAASGFLGCGAAIAGSL